MEDLLLRINDFGINFVAQSAYDAKFLRSLTRRVRDDNPLTTRQGWALVKTLKAHARLGEAINLTDALVEETLANPEWKQPLVPSVDVKSEVRHLGDNVLGFRATLGRPFQNAISNLKPVYSHGLTLVEVKSGNLEDIISVIGSFGFDIDEATEKYLADAMAHRGGEARVISMEDKMIFDVPNDPIFAQFVRHVLGADYL